MLNALIVITSIAQVILSLFVLQRSRDNLSNRLFFFIGITTLCWAVTNYLTIVLLHSSSVIYVVRTIMFFVVLGNTAFYLFAKTFPGTRLMVSRRKLAAYFVLTGLAASASLSPFLFTSVHIKQNIALTTAGPGIMLFMIHAAFSIVGAFRSLIHKLNRATGADKAQLQILLLAAVLNWVVVPITNFAAGPLLKTTFFIKYGPVYTLAFASLIAYAIVSRKLFDIRATVARSVGYLMVVLSITLVYGVGLFGVIDVLLPGTQHQMERQIISVILITPLALVFQRTKLFFDRITSRLFFRDSYDMQEVLDVLGTVATNEIELYKLLTGARKVLLKALKSSFVEFVLMKEGKPYFEARTHKAVSQALLALGKPLVEHSHELIVSDELSPQHPLYDHLRAANVGLALRLKTHDQLVGYIVFGPKRSGDIYTLQDKKLLTIIANELAITIQNALRFEQIQNFNLTLQAKVDEATRQLRKNNEKLKQLDETKDDFVSMASHQLRTPLTSVKGYISMVLDGDAGKLNPTQRQLLEQAFESSQRMVYLISDLLNVSRLRTGKFVIEPTRVNLAQLVAQEIDQLVRTAAAKQLTLTYHKPESFPSLMLDETKTRQVIMNFVDNAIYYTPAGGHIEVKLVETPASVELRVVDDGIGVPKSEVPHLFTKFYRAGNARKARPDGTGLGLFMAKKVIVAEGGALIFGTEEGKGSTFGFVFSKTKLADGAPASAPPATERAAK